MIKYDEIILDNNKTYKIIRKPGYGGCTKCYNKAVSNMNSMLAEGRKISIISPRENLTKESKEQYRRYFCKLAKDIGRNMIYFEGPVEVKECDPLDGTMFA